MYFDLGGDDESRDLVCGLGHGHAAVLLRRGGRDGRRSGHERDYLGHERAGAQKPHDRGAGRDEARDPEPRRRADRPHQAQGGRTDDARRDGHRYHGDGLDAAAEVDRIGTGGHLRRGRDDRDRDHRERGRGSGGRSQVPVHDGEPGRYAHRGAGRLRSGAQHPDQSEDHLQGEGGRRGQRRDLDRRRRHHLRDQLARAHPHGRARDQHRSQPPRSRHAVRPQGGRLAERGRHEAGVAGGSGRGEGVHQQTHADLQRAARPGLGGRPRSNSRCRSTAARRRR